MRTIIKPQIRIVGNIVAELDDVITRDRRVIRGKNLVTYAGDLYYTSLCAREVPTNDFAASCYMQLGFDDTAPTKSDTKCGSLIAGSAKLVYDLYPCRDDQDPKNTGAGIYTVSYKFEWDALEVVEDDMAECIIAISDAAEPDAILMRGLFSPKITKKSSQILRVWVNHTILGS